MNSETNDAADLNGEKLDDKEKEVKVGGKSSRSLSFCERIK
jgi:hypothetical protein